MNMTEGMQQQYQGQQLGRLNTQGDKREQVKAKKPFFPSTCVLDATGRFRVGIPFSNSLIKKNLSQKCPVLNIILALLSIWLDLEQIYDLMAQYLPYAFKNYIICFTFI